MANHEARIVLLGRPSKLTKNKFKNNLLSEVNPTEIPKQFIEKIDVTFSSGQVVQFDTSKLKSNFTMEAVKDFLKQYDKNSRVGLIEITLDLEKIYNTLQRDSDTIFAKYFQ
jgi:hypothetical protein